MTAPTGRPRGRPSLPPAERRPHRASVYLSAAELAEIVRVAGGAADAVPAYLRAAGLRAAKRARKRAQEAA